MPGVIVGLDIGEGVVAGVRVKSGLRGLELMGASVAAYSVEEGLGAGLERLSGMMDLGCDTSCVALPASLFSFRNLRLPFTDKKKVRQTLGFELESMSAIPISDTAFDFSIYDTRDGSGILAAVIPAGVLAEYLSCLGNAGLDPEILTVGRLPVLAWYLRREETPEQGIYIDLGVERAVLYGFFDRRPALIRDIPLRPARPAVGGEGPGGVEDHSNVLKAVLDTLHAFSHLDGVAFRPQAVLASGPAAGEVAGLLASELGAEARTVDLFSEGAVRPGKGADMVADGPALQGALGLALAAASRLDMLNLRAGAFARRRDPSGIRRKATAAAVWILVPLLLGGADLWVEYRVLRHRHQALAEAIKAVYRETFPGAGKVVDPLSQMKIALREALKSRGDVHGETVPVVEIMRDISARVPGSLEMRITRLAADQEAVRITGRTDTFNTVNSIRDSLSPSGYYSAVTISSAVQDQSGKGVQFEMVLQRAR